MASASKDKWLKFFLDAKIPKNAAEEYTLTFVENRIQFDMLLDLDKDYLNAMGITVMGDIIAILRHAKVCHVQNAKKTMLNSTSTTAKKETLKNTNSNNYRSVSIKPKTNSTSNLNLNPKSSTNLNPDKLHNQNTNNNNSKNKNGTVSRKVERVTVVKNKPTLVRTPLVRKRPIETTVVTEKQNESYSSDSEHSVDEITKKMSKKSIFDRLGYSSKSGSPPADSSERAVTSSTSPNVILSSVLERDKNLDQNSKGRNSVESRSEQITVQSPTSPSLPKPGTLSYRMFSHCQSTSPVDHDEVEDDNDHVEMTEMTSTPSSINRVEYTVALPPSFLNTTAGTSSQSSNNKVSGSVFDRLGDKSKEQSSTSNPSKSILKLSSQSIRINKSSSNLLSTKRDPKSITTLNNKLSLIRSQVNTEGVLGNPSNLTKDKLPAKARIGHLDSATTSSQLKNTPSSMSSKNNGLIKSRLTLNQSDKKPVINSRLDALAQRTLKSTPAHIKARIESEQPKHVKNNGGLGIKARLGFKKPLTREKIVISHDDFETISDEIIEREILSNDEADADMTLDGKKKVRFHCVEKKLIPPRRNINKRFPNVVPYSKFVVW